MDLDEFLISVIVPVYKVEDFLEQCIQSIQNQTYRRLEIILVDDGSRDKCGEICDRYAASDERIRVIHKENGGLADARNCGLDVATGDYIAFVDSDDLIHPRMYERMMQALEESRAEVVISEWRKVYPKEKIVHETFSNKPVVTIWSKNSVQNGYFDQPDKRITYTVAWNKLYKKSLFNEIRFPKGKLHEDEFVTFEVLYIAKKIAYLPEAHYYYVSRDESIMGSFRIGRFDLFDAYHRRLCFYMDNGEYELAQRTYFMAIHMLMQYRQWAKTDKKGSEAFNIYYKAWCKTYGEIKNSLQCSMTQKIEVSVFRYFRIVYQQLWKLKRVL